MRGRLLKNMNPSECLTRNCNYNMIGIGSIFTNRFKFNGKRY